MTYVPVVPSPPTPPSPRTRELASLLAKVLEEYRKTHPSVTSAEIRNAFKLASMGSRGGRDELPALVVAGFAGLLCLAALGFFVFRASGEGDWPLAMPVVVMTMIVLLLVVLRVKSR